MTETEFKHQHALLGNRSSKILGGYVTEEMFIHTFLSPDIPCTQSWWFSNTADRRTFWFVVKRSLTELDMEIYSRLHNCFQLYTENGTWAVRSIQTGEIWTLECFVARFQLRPIGKQVPRADDSPYEREILTRCINYYAQNGMLTDIQRSIQIEDLFLNKYFYTSNLDLIIGRKKSSSIVPVCVEIKFKDPFLYEGKEVYGIDRYQLKGEYFILEQAGIQTYAVVLHDCCRDRTHKTSTNIFRYLDLVALEDRQWIYARISKNAGYPEYQMASTGTGFAGVEKKSRPVFCIPRHNFRSLDRLNTLLADEQLLDFDGNPVLLCPKCGRRLRERKSAYGPFLGCSGYPGCKHTQRIT